MNRLILMIFLFFTSACMNKPVQQITEDLQSTPAEKVINFSKIDFTKPNKELVFDQKLSLSLEPTDGVVSTVKGQKSYYKLLKVVDQKAAKYIEIYSMHYRPAGFGGEFRIIHPELFLFDNQGKKLSTALIEVSRAFESSFVHGKYMRTVFKLSEQNHPAFIVLTAKGDRLGQNAMQVTNYGAASVGVIYDEVVLFAPTGWVKVLLTNEFKK